MIVYVWTAAATIGALIAAWNMVDAWRDLHALGDVENGRRMLARGWVRREFIRFGIQATWAWIGFQAIPTADPNAPLSVLVVLLVGTNVAVAVNTLMDAWERILLRRLLNG